MTPASSLKVHRSGYCPGPLALRVKLILLALLNLAGTALFAQDISDSTLDEATLDNVVRYALNHQPQVHQAELDEEITQQQINVELADWLPQVNFNYNYQHYIDLQSSVIGGNVIRFGVNNTSSAQFTATQTIFNRDVLLASSTAHELKTLSGLNSSRTRIDLVVEVSKAFYDVLATTQQIQVTQESIIRLQKSYADAYSRYSSGIADKTDYQRASIQLNNARATLKANEEQLKSKKQHLKTLMGYPSKEEITVAFDPEELEREAVLDTLQQLNYSANIDYKILVAQQELQDADVKYSYWSFIPSLNAFGAYNLNYQNNQLSELYSTRYPYSYIGATLSIPILQGGKRLANIHLARLRQSRLDEQMINLQNQLRADFHRAMAAYKSNLALFNAQQENVAMAQDVYDVIQLQYENGVKTYLDVIIAESDLRTTRLNYYNTLYMLLSSKMDVLRALGQLNY